VLALDDGTGVVQVSVFTAHWDGRATHHYAPAVGEAVVAAGRLAFAWQLGAASGRVREVQARSLRAAVSDDELPAHWLETLALHARVYCRSPADLLRPAVPADALARLSPMAPAGLALRRTPDAGSGAAGAGAVCAPQLPVGDDGRGDDGAAEGDDSGGGGGDDDDDLDEAWFTGLLLRIIKELHPHSQQDRSDAAEPAVPQTHALPSQASLEASLEATADVPLDASPPPPPPPPPPPLPLPLLAEHFTAQQLLAACSAHASVQRVLGSEAGGQLRYALDGGGGGGVPLLARLRRALAALERHGEVFRPGAPPPPLPPPLGAGASSVAPPPPADDALYCPVSTCRVLLPALRAVLAREPPDRHASKRARTMRDDGDSSDASPPRASSVPWPIADILRALASQPATRHVPRRRVRDALALMLVRGEAGETDRAYFLEDS